MCSDVKLMSGSGAGSEPSGEPAPTEEPELDGATKLALSEAAQARVVEMEEQVQKAQEAMEQAKVEAGIAKNRAVRGDRGQELGSSVSISDTVL